MTLLLDDMQTPVVLGQVFGRGGQGEVREVAGRSDTVAKIYHVPPGERGALKLRAMTTLGTHMSMCAWPRQILRRSDGALAGFLMPRAAGRRFSSAMETPLRLDVFRDFSWHFLVRIARNVAALFSEVHRHGVVIGDVSDGNFFVNDRAEIIWIDCDSCQLRAGGDVFPCSVGTPGWLAPELIGTDLKSVPRTADHDVFGMALLIFRLLFCGRHPFAGVPTGEAVGLDAAMAAHRFVYSRRSPDPGLRPPPWMPGLEILTGEVASLFERTFLSPALRQGVRPPAAEWIAPLERLESALASCPENALHVFYRALPECPWCALERRNIRLFALRPRPIPLPTALHIGTAGSVPKPDPDIWRRLQTLVNNLQSISHPVCPSPTRPAGIAPKPMPSNSTWISALLPGFRCILPPAKAYAEERQRRLHLLATEQQNLRQVEQRWTRTLSWEWSRFETLRRKAAETRDDLSKASALYHAHRQEFIDSLKNDWISSHLKTRRIADAKLAGIGATRLGALHKAGIRTAAEISANMKVPGVGPHFIRLLLAWRKRLAASYLRRHPFQPDPAALKTWRTHKENRLLQLQTTAVNRANQALQASDKLTLLLGQARREIDAIGARLAQAEADAAGL